MPKIQPLCIFLMFVFFGCEDKKETESPCADCGMEITSDLPQIDGIYQLIYNPNLAQTYESLYAETNCGWSKHIRWDSNYLYEVAGQQINLVNPGSMTDDDGNAQVIFAVWPPFIGYTITIYGGYEDDCGTFHMDSIKVKINDY